MREYISSGINHVKVISTTSNEYANAFGYIENDIYGDDVGVDALINILIREGNRNVKEDFGRLPTDGSIKTGIEEMIEYEHLDNNATAIWSLLFASGYLKVVNCETVIDRLDREWIYELAITNHETRKMFEGMVRGWFGSADVGCNGFVRAMA